MASLHRFCNNNISYSYIVASLHNNISCTWDRYIIILAVHGIVTQYNFFRYSSEFKK